MTRRIKFLLMLLLADAAVMSAQVITCNPVFPVASDAVTITFNADKGDMGLKDYPGDDIYAHTGVITDKSTSGSDWKYEVAKWGTFLPKAKLTKVSDNVYTLTITPSIREYYGVPEEEKILKLAFVFRNTAATGTRTGRDIGGADIFYTVYETVVFDVMLTSPDRYSSIVSTGENLNIQASASMADSLILLQNNTRLKKVNDLSVSHSVTATGEGLFKIVARAWHNLQMKEDSAFYYIMPAVTVEDVPAGLKPGVSITADDRAAFLLYAPGKDNVFVTGDFTDWIFRDEGFMKKSNDGNWFWLEINGLDPAEEYGFQYLIDGDIAIPDPYATKILDPSNDNFISEDTYPGLKDYPSGLTEGLVSVFKTRPAAYTWKNGSFTPVPKTQLVAYELLVRDFVAKHDFKTIIDTLDYFTRLGVNAIEFMPVTEFEGNNSWGYNPSMYFAVDKYYGPADSFKELIDSCHSRGIAVIMDMVLNHAYGSNPLVRMYYDKATYKVTPDNPWFNVDAPNTAYSWGYDFNHTSSETQSFVDSVCHYWIDEFKVDGFRFDFTKGFTNTSGDGWAYDASRIAILKRMGDRIWSYKPDAYLILEHFADNQEEKTLAGYGFMLWGKAKTQYQEASMGFESDLSDASYLDLGWTQPGIMDYMESHDEERIMYKNIHYGNSYGTYNIRNFDIALKRAKLAALFFFTIPGPKMIWQFEELGYDITNGDYGRVGEMPIHWEYYGIAGRRNLFENFSALIDLRKKYPTFSTSDYSLYQTGSVKRLNLEHTDMDAVVMGNFGVTASYVNGNFTRTGKWYDFFSGDSVDITATTKQLRIDLTPGQYRLYTSRKITRPGFLASVHDLPVINNIAAQLKSYPNPSAGDLTIVLPEAIGKDGVVDIFSAAGTPVRRLIFTEGTNEIYWDGRDNTGKKVPPGIYLLRADSGGSKSYGRVVRQ